MERSLATTRRRLGRLASTARLGGPLHEAVQHVGVEPIDPRADVAELVEPGAPGHAAHHPSSLLHAAVEDAFAVVARDLNLVAAPDHADGQLGELSLGSARSERADQIADTHSGRLSGLA